MFHNERRFCLKGCSSVEELVAEIAGEDKVLCRAWRLEEYLFLNDSCNRQGTFEVAVLRIKGHEGNRALCDQLDSLTVDLYSPEGIRDQIKMAMNPDVLPYGEVRVTVEGPEEHGHCHWCA